VFDHNLFDFTLASGVYNLEKLTAVVIQTRGNLGAIENNTITALAAGFNLSFALADKILSLFLCRNASVQGNVSLCSGKAIGYRQKLLNLRAIIPPMPTNSTMVSQLPILEPPMQGGLGEPIFLCHFRLPQQHPSLPRSAKFRILVYLARSRMAGQPQFALR